MSRLLIVVLALVITSCDQPPPLLDRVKARGELVVLTRDNPTTYYKNRKNVAGFEHDLVKMFALEIGVKVRFVVPGSIEMILEQIAHHKAHFAAAGVLTTEKYKQEIHFTPGYAGVTQQLIYRRGKKPSPKALADTIGGTLEIIADSNHEEILLKQEIPGLTWVSHKQTESLDLLQMVNEQMADYTIASSNEATLIRRIYPKLRVAADLTKPQPLGWAFPRSSDASLYDAASQFLKRAKKDGRMTRLVDHYYGNTYRLRQIDIDTLKKDAKERLPQYIDLFKEAAIDTGLDWKLLAAISYQESHWKSEAVSPTGVRGIMMLTNNTAKRMNVKDRTDPAQSIHGGAHYFRLMEEMIPDRIASPDRLSLALAAYNVGYGHLEDARILTKRRGGNPDAWVDIRRNLPLLSRPEYYNTVKHGRARGNEPVKYVGRVWGYYDLLTWLYRQDSSEPKFTSTR